MSDKLKIVISSIKMATATLLSRLLGLVREQVMAHYFGASGFTDAFLVAYRVPNLLRDLFAEGAFSSAFVPIFLEEKLKNPEKSKGLLWSLVISLTIITGTISILMMVFASDLVAIFAPSFVEEPGKFQVTVQLTQIMAPFLTLVSLAALFMGVLNSLKLFFIPSLAPAFFNIVMILCMLLMPTFLESRNIHPIISCGIGVILGGLAQMFMQIPFIFIKKYGFSGPINLLSAPVKKISGRMGIGTIGVAASQINLLITTILATSTVVGAVSWLSYAFRLFQFPVGVFGVSVAGSNLVHFSEAWKSDDHQKAKEHLLQSYHLSYLLILPATFLMFSLSDTLIQLIFERGKFLPSDTEMTSLALKYYLLGLPFYGLYKIFSPVFYTLDRPQIPVIISVLSIAINVVFCLIFTPKYGFQILALGTSLSMMINCLLQMILISKKLELPKTFFLRPLVFKLLGAACVCYVSSLYLKDIFNVVGNTLFLKGMNFLIISALAFLAYLMTLVILGEGKILKNLRRKKIKKP